jgi:hypothetical protein
MYTFSTRSGSRRAALSAALLLAMMSRNSIRRLARRRFALSVVICRIFIVCIFVLCTESREEEGNARPTRWKATPAQYAEGAMGWSHEIHLGGCPPIVSLKGLLGTQVTS